MDGNGTRYYTIDEPKKKKSKKKTVIIFVIVLVAVFVMGWLLTSMTKDSQEAPNGDHITIMHVEGTIQPDASDAFTTYEYNHSWTLEQIDEAIYDDNNRGLILFIDSPGGAVYETDEVYLKLLEYKETGKPYYVAMGSMAASGGYYMAAPADKIFANRNCWTGSIGVTMGTFYDISGLLEEYNIETETITSGDNKAMGSSVEPMTKEQREIFQSLVDEAYEQFVGIVADGRDMSVKEVKQLADGRIYTAQQAVKNGLVDEIGTLEDAVADMMATYDLYDCIENEVEYENDDLWSSLFAGVTAVKQENQSDLAALVSLMEEQGQVPIMYMTEMQK